MSCSTRAKRRPVKLADLQRPDISWETSCRAHAPFRALPAPPHSQLSVSWAFSSSHGAHTAGEEAHIACLMHAGEPGAPTALGGERRHRRRLAPGGAATPRGRPGASALAPLSDLPCFVSTLAEEEADARARGRGPLQEGSAQVVCIPAGAARRAAAGPGKGPAQGGQGGRVGWVGGEGGWGGPTIRSALSCFTAHKQDGRRAGGAWEVPCRRRRSSEPSASQ